ncbi:serine/threonine-protein kinase [Streptomyces sp. CB01373]|uniref:serine/threonine-protein kinase n=1 Tax=Streptomyces sp. CB01373 TaxID=2020325 RepID=UPI000C277B27|nr:serine/threonine-protein kinase [Streptomyces sp. CB01373]PJM91669.1 serine/threonine protein kinase [Streptomyces sp. CB01373]
MQPLEEEEPATVGPYRLLGRLGSGGMGRVYLGRSAGGRTVAVKIVHPHFALDEEFRARFRREVEAARRVGGAWTAPVLDADPGAPVPWVATAYAAGPSLAAAVADAGPLPGHSVRALGAGLAEALAAVHELGLVHRDVKPSNVLLTLDGPLLIDFGIARATDGTASLTSTGVSVGSPGYMSPEQILGKGVTGAADVFSLGAVLVHAATGEPPFRGDSSAALLYKVVHEEPELGSLSGDLRDLAAACLAKDPAARPGPGEVARRLAPEGASRLIVAGWLPSRLVEQVSRSAVSLLNLEATAPDPPAQPPSGPLNFSRISVPGPSPKATDDRPQPTEAVPDGGFGPSLPGPFPGAATGERPRPAEAGLGGGFGPPPSMPASPPPSLPAREDTPPQGTTAPVTARGRFSVTVADGAAPGAEGRGRRLSCTMVLVLAGALAVVTAGSVLWLLPFRDGGEDSAGGTPPPAATASGDHRSTGPTTTGSPVPARYLGTWEGQGTALDGTLPLGDFRLTVHQAAVGQELGTLHQTDQLGGVCDDVLTLKQVTSTELVAVSRGAKTNHAGCNPAPHTVRLAPVGEDIKYTADSSAEGNPVARLSKVK